MLQPKIIIRKLTISLLKNEKTENAMLKFEYCSPTKIVFGKDTEERTAELIKENGGSRIVIVYGGKSVIESGLLKRIE